MHFGQNLQLLRKIRSGMTQEELAGKIGVSRQTVSKWELNAAYPEIEKVIELCALFSCSMDQLIREDMGVIDESYSDIRCEWVESFRYLQYAVVSADPEGDAIGHVTRWAEELKIEAPRIIGWDFPTVSQEQINLFHMHGYAAALILEDGIALCEEGMEIVSQPRQQYVALTIRQPFTSPFRVIPNAFKVLLTYMKANGIKARYDKAVLSCFERVYTADGVEYMDVYVARE